MLLEINKTVTETLEIPIPSYYKAKYGDRVICINENEDVIIAGTGMIVVWAKSSGYFWRDTVNEALSEKFEPCSAEDFQKAYESVLGKIRTAYEVNLIPQS